MVDMHCHILFGVDDGAKNINDSMVLIREEASMGVKHIICTPHYEYNGEYTREKVLNNFELLKDIVQAERINVELYLGNEIYFNSSLFETLESKQFFTLAGSDYLLIEFNYLSTPKNIADICYEIKIKGFIPVIAHIERYSLFYNDINSLNDVINEGALLQINASSLIKKENKDSYKFVSTLLKNKIVSFIASDVHDITHRRFYLKEAYEAVKKVYGISYADMIFIINPHKILSNKIISINQFESDDATSRKSIFSKFWKK